MTTIVFDIETLYFFSEPAIRRMPREAQLMALEFGCAVALIDGVRKDYRPEDVPDLWNDLFLADTIVTFNGLSFDLPIVAFEFARLIGSYPGWPEGAQVDLLDIARRATGRWYKLDDIAAATLGRRKTATGYKAAEWLRSGDPANVQKAIDYCAMDTEITADLWQALLDGEPLVLPPQPDKRNYDGALVWAWPDGAVAQVQPQPAPSLRAQWVAMRPEYRAQSGIGFPEVDPEEWILCEVLENGSWLRTRG